MVEDIPLSLTNISNIHVPKQFQFSIIRPKHRSPKLIFTFQMFKGKPQYGFDVPLLEWRGSSGMLAPKPTMMESPYNCVSWNTNYRRGLVSHNHLSRCSGLLADFSDCFPLWSSRNIVLTATSRCVSYRIWLLVLANGAQYSISRQRETLGNGTINWTLIVSLH